MGNLNLIILGLIFSALLFFVGFLLEFLKDENKRDFTGALKKSKDQSIAVILFAIAKSLLK